MTETWVRGFLSRMDRLQPDVVLPEFADDACFRIGNADPAVGPQAIRRALVKFFRPLASLRHEALGVWCPHPGAVMLEATVRCRRKDGVTADLPAATILRFEDGKIVDYRMLIDASPITS